MRGTESNASMTSSGTALSPADLDDIQAIVHSGFAKLTGCTYLLLRIHQPQAARAWLRSQRIANVADLKKGYLPEIMQLAVTSAGLTALGCAADIVNGFSPEFVVGMAGDPSRSSRLGDTGANAPQDWRWGAGDMEPHLLVMLFSTEELIEALSHRISAEVAAAGMTQITQLTTSDMKGREPFGFTDGVSQPAPDWHGQYQATPTDNMVYRNHLALGEVLLGYRNEYGLFTERPLIDSAGAGTEMLPPAIDDPDRHDVGRNGSYLVFRQLDQDVRGFWRWVHQAAGDADPVSLAETMVGRQLSGDPLSGFATEDIPGIEPKDRGQNGFTFMQDKSGQHCPFGAHIRRANPRTGDFPDGRQGIIAKLIAIFGLSGTAEDDTIASSRFHRLIRRGREYGRSMEPSQAALPDAPDPQSGLHFICLNANIARQFEFVQAAWLENAKFAGLTGESDPLLGTRRAFPADQPTDSFRQPDAGGPSHVLRPVPQFIFVRGGAYFFLPGLRALSWLTKD